MRRKKEFPGLIGNSPEMVQLRKHLPIIADGDDNVIIYGETGTEKMASANVIFSESGRTEQPLITTDASRLNADFESELAPLKSGSNGQQLRGTVIIEDLHNLDKNAQAKLLPLAKRSIIKDDAGSAAASNIRIIATALPEIQEKMQKGVFNSELFLLISAFSVKIPSLRDRKQDIPFLFEHFLKEFAAETGKELPPVNFEVFNQMLKHNWLGNTKELENTVRNMVLQSTPTTELNIDALPFVDEKEPFSRVQIQDINIAVSNLEKELINKTLRKFAGNQSNAARILGISETNLRYKMKKLGIRRRDFTFGKQNA
jgi:DNA-binding NtrC family response regulator